MYFFLYNRKKEKIDFKNIKIFKLIPFIFIIVFFGFYFLQNSDSKFSKFLGPSAFDSLYETLEYTRGGSAYLVNLKVNSFFDVILYSPIKFLYFLFSPMPWNWRGISDISTFIMDSIVYLYLLVIVLKNKKNNIVKSFGLCFLVLAFVFGLGTYTAGAAARHRYNVLPFLLVTACYSTSYMKAKK